MKVTLAESPGTGNKAIVIESFLGSLCRSIRSIASGYLENSDRFPSIR